jgi:hypothetical protein
MSFGRSNSTNICFSSPSLAEVVGGLDIYTASIAADDGGRRHRLGGGVMGLMMSSGKGMYSAGGPLRDTIAMPTRDILWVERVGS